MARQDLLDERGARTRQTDDENWIGRGRAPAAAPGEEILREKSKRAIHKVGNFVGIVIEREAAKAIALAIMLEGFRVRLFLLQRLSKCEMQVPAVFLPQLCLPEMRFHHTDITAGETQLLEIGETPPRLAERGQDLDALAVGD